MPKIELIHGDCLVVMDELIAKDITVDAIICDPPYGTTACRWDSVIPFDKMWERLNKLIKPNGAIVLFGSEPFSSALRMSNIKNYKYDWVWEKEKAGNFQLAKKRPMKKTENLSVFYSQQCLYNPQGLVEINRVNKNNTNKGGSMGHMSSVEKRKTYIQTHTNYPNEKLKFNNEKGLHESQKPVALMEYLIKTYTNEGEVVLDFTMGSGTTGVACKNLNRNFIGIELDPEYFKIAEARINAMENKPFSLFDA
jgi:DNA modification methylase